MGQSTCNRSETLVISSTGNFRCPPLYFLSTARTTAHPPFSFSFVLNNTSKVQEPCGNGVGEVTDQRIYYIRIYLYTVYYHDQKPHLPPENIMNLKRLGRVFRRRTREPRCCGGTTWSALPRQPAEEAGEVVPTTSCRPAAVMVESKHHRRETTTWRRLPRHEATELPVAEGCRAQFFFM